MTSLTTRTGRAPSGWLLLSTAVTLATVLAAAVWLLQGGDTASPSRAPAIAEHAVGTPHDILTGTEKGGLAELQDGLAQAHPTPPPYVVYLVDSVERQHAMTELGLAEGEVVVVAGTSEEMAIAQIHIQLLEMSAAMAPDARAVQVVDLHQPPVTHVTDSSALAGSAEEWATWLQEQAVRASLAIATDGAPSDGMARTGAAGAESEHVFLVASAEEAELLRTLGEPGGTRRVVVVGHTQEDRVMRALAEDDAIRYSFGLPGITVVDLRVPALGPTSTCGMDAHSLVC